MPRAGRVCPEDGCPNLTTGGRCDECRHAADAARGSRHQRGYDNKHLKARARALPHAYGTPCPRCGEPMLEGQALDWGHSEDLAANPHARADRMEHASCNRAAGAQLGNQERSQQ